MGLDAEKKKKTNKNLKSIQKGVQSNDHNSSNIRFEHISPNESNSRNSPHNIAIKTGI